ncbi:hypothetical protein D3C78_1953110 [compost metagenome]
MPSALTMNAWPWPPKFSELIMALMLDRSMSAPATPIIWFWCCTGVATVITSLPDEAAM